MVAIYACARTAFSKKQFDWESEAVRCAIPRLGYVPNLETDTNISQASPLRGFVDVTSRVVSSVGWLQHDLITFAGIPVNENFDRVTMYRVSDGLLLFDVPFPTINLPASVPLTMPLDVSSIGLGRV
jgi:hypothetical protein